MAWPCAIMKHLRLLKRIGYSNVCALANDPSAFFFEGGMMIDADGGYHAYHPDGKSGLDYLANAGVPGHWWALVTDDGKRSGTPVLQTGADPAPGFFISTTTLQDRKLNRRDPRRYVNAEAINYFVLPGRSTFGARVGDVGVAFHPQTGAYDYAVFADAGPAGRIG